MSVWYAWSNLFTYAVGNIKGLLNLTLDWFRTPKYVRGRVGTLSRLPTRMRVINRLICVGLLGFYFIEGFIFGWFDEFALLWLPAFLIASFN
jgi:hypothetical protein